MAKSAVAADFNQATDIALDLTAEVAFDLVIGINNLAQSPNLGVAQVANLGSRIKVRLGDDFGCVVLTDAVNEGQGIKNGLVSREVDACNTCHLLLLFS
jgi:hypothetical protein